MSRANLVDARAYIEANYDQTVSLAQLADLAELSVSRFATLFRKQFGSSPYKYLCELRVRRAQTLLLAGVPGSIVAAEVGFFDQSHLARHFKRVCGMTPSAYIENARKRALARSAEFDAGCRERFAQSEPRILALDGAQVA
jgi:AraC-like DNA-binding protein